jgi:hypothetical protein
VRPTAAAALLASLLGSCGAPGDGPADAPPADDAPGPADAASPDAEPPTGPARFGGCPAFPADTVFHADLRGLPVHPRSAEWLAYVGLDDPLWLPVQLDTTNPLAPVRYGDPIHVADAATPRVTVAYNGTYPVEAQYAGPFPQPTPFDIETGFDQHTIVVDTDECAAYELIGASLFDRLRASGGARWELRSVDYLPNAHSVTAPGFPLLGTVLRADELRAGYVDHPLSFVIPQVRSTEPLWPARRTDGTGTAADAMPMGAWLRLKASVDTSGFPPAARIVAEGLKVHGMILGDSGGVDGAVIANVEKTADWVDASGASLEADLASIREVIEVSDFEVVDASGLVVSPDSLQVR